MGSGAPFGAVLRETSRTGAISSPPEGPIARSRDGRMAARSGAVDQNGSGQTDPERGPTPRRCVRGPARGTRTSTRSSERDGALNLTSATLTYDKGALFWHNGANFRDRVAGGRWYIRTGSAKPRAESRAMRGSALENGLWGALRWECVATGDVRVPRAVQGADRPRSQGRRRCAERRAREGEGGGGRRGHRSRSRSPEPETRPRPPETSGRGQGAWRAAGGEPKRPPDSGINLPESTPNAARTTSFHGGPR